MALLPMYPGKVNSPVTELVSDIDEVQDTIEVSDGLALPDAPNIAVIGSGEDAETIQYGTKTGNVLSDVVRGFQGVAKAWSAGQKVARNFTAYDYEALRMNIKNHGSEHNHDGSDPIPDLVQLRDDYDTLRQNLTAHLDEKATDHEPPHGMGLAAAQDYEEGEFTPRFTGSGTYVYTKQYGKYTLIGDICFIRGEIELASESGGNPNDLRRLAGFPVVGENNIVLNLLSNYNPEPDTIGITVENHAITFLLSDGTTEELRKRHLTNNTRIVFSGFILL